MLRQSQSLLFRPPTISKFKIHPPLPLNPRESKQLLNLLTTSFRQRLDVEHGEFRATVDIKSSQDHQSLKAPRQRRRSFAESRPTDQHMNSILTNPLFNLGLETKASNTERDPMEVFDLAVAKGMMNLHYAKACLNAKKRDIIQSPILSVREGMRESGAGLKVLKWLISSGTANNNDFLKDTSFAPVLLEYMVAEELQEVVWKWITRAFKTLPEYWKLDFAQRKAHRREMIGPLYLLIRAEASDNVSLDAAFICLSRAAGYLKGLTTTQMREILSSPGKYLVHQVIKLHSERPVSSTSAFDSFFSLVPLLAKSNYQLAHLSLRHPSQPNAVPALAFLRDLSSSARRSATDMETIQMSLDAAKLLLETEQYTDAQWVMDFLRETYPNQLGIVQRESLEQTEAEASSLQLLDKLSLA
jgi:hypothetical protein